MAFKLNRDQAAARRAISKHVKGKGDPFVVLLGHAGTGKTTTWAHTLKSIKNKTVWTTAPTHRAVSVARAMNNKAGAGTDVHHRTIQSALGMRPVWKAGEMVFAKRHAYAFSDGDIIEIDEGSQIPAEIAAQLVKAARDMPKCRFVIVADPLQLPPVNEASSGALELGKQHVLTEIVRQEAGNPIIVLCDRMRTAIETGKRPEIKTDFCSTNKRGVIATRGPQWAQWALSAFERGGRFDEDPNSVRAVAWTNPRVNQINQRIHNARYAGTKTPFATEQRVIMGDTVSSYAQPGNEELKEKEGQEVAANNQAEGTVVGIEPDTHPHFPIPGWVVTVEVDDGGTMSLRWLEPKGLAAFNALAQDLHNNQEWRKLRRLRMSYADIRHPYAMTAHKAQGGTFKSVFVDAQNILSNPNRNEALRCLYVAASRATDTAAMLLN